MQLAYRSVLRYLRKMVENIYWRTDNDHKTKKTWDHSNLYKLLKKTFRGSQRVQIHKLDDGCGVILTYF